MAGRSSSGSSSTPGSAAIGSAVNVIDPSPVLVGVFLMGGRVIPMLLARPANACTVALNGVNGASPTSRSPEVSATSKEKVRGVNMLRFESTPINTLRLPSSRTSVVTGSRRTSLGHSASVAPSGHLYCSPRSSSMIVN